MDTKKRILLILAFAAAASACSDRPQRYTLDSGVESDTDRPQPDAGGEDAAVSDAVSDAADEDAGSDVGPDTGPESGLLVQLVDADPDREVQAVLGRGDDVQVQMLDSDGETRFTEPGPGPYTVTLLPSEGGAAFTWAQAPGPVVRFERPPFGGRLTPLPDEEVSVQLSGDVTGVGGGNDVTVELLADGQVYDRDEDVSDGYEIDLSSFGVGTGQALHLAVTERNADGDLVAIGIVEVTDDLQSAIDREISVEADVAVDHDLSVTATDKTVDEPLTASAEIALGDGFTYAPFNLRTELSGGEGTLTLPTLTGSLQGFEIKLMVGSLNPNIVLSEHQTAIRTLTSPLPASIAVELLPQPQFVTAVGEEEAVEHPADAFSLELSGPAENTAPLWLAMRRDGETCGSPFAWLVNLPASATSFMPFDLRDDLPFTPVPSNVALEITALVTDGEARHSGAEGRIKLTEDVTCDTPVPAWLSGEFVGIGMESGGQFVDDSRLKIEECGRFRYDIEGGDFRGAFCGRAVEENGQFLLRADDEFRFLFNGETEALVESRSPAFEGLDGLGVTNQTSSETAIFVRQPDPQPATLNDLLPGAYQGVEVTMSTYANDAGSPGVELSTEGPFPADGTAQGIGDYSVEITDDARYAEIEAFPLGGYIRRGVVSSFDGSTGKVGLTNGPGIVSDDDHTLDLGRETDGTVTITSIQEVTDVDDDDSDGDTTDTVFAARIVELAPVMP